MTPAHDPRRAQLRRLKAPRIGPAAVDAGRIRDQPLAGRARHLGLGFGLLRGCCGRRAGRLVRSRCCSGGHGPAIPHTAIIPRSKRIATAWRCSCATSSWSRVCCWPSCRCSIGQPAASTWHARACWPTWPAAGAAGAGFFDETAVPGSCTLWVQQLRQWNAAATAGELLALLTADGRHQRVLDEACSAWDAGWSSRK